MAITTFPIIDVKLPPSVNVFYLDSGIAVFGVPSNPEGIVAAFPGSFAVDVATGNWYRKSAGVGTVGWVIAGASGVFSNVPRAIFRNFTPTGNVGAGLDTLHSFTLDTPNRLLTDGDYVKGRFAGLFATNDNNKRPVIQFDGQTIFDSGLLDLDGAVGRDHWAMDTMIARVSSTTVNAITFVEFGQLFADGAGTFSSTNGLSRSFVVNAVVVTNMTNNPIVLRVAGEGVADNDIVQHTSIVEICQQ